MIPPYIKHLAVAAADCEALFCLKKPGVACENKIGKRYVSCLSLFQIDLYLGEEGTGPAGHLIAAGIRVGCGMFDVASMKSWGNVLPAKAPLWQENTPDKKMKMGLQLFLLLRFGKHRQGIISPSWTGLTAVSACPYLFEPCPGRIVERDLDSGQSRSWFAVLARD